MENVIKLFGLLELDLGLDLNELFTRGDVLRIVRTGVQVLKNT